MKKLKIYSYTILICVAIATVTGCEKLSLLKNEDVSSVPAGENLKTETIWQFISADNFHESDLTAVGLYGKAVERAGLKDLLNQSGNYTVIIPSDKALSDFIQSIGYQSVDDVPPVILRNFLLDNIFNTKVHSFDIEANEIKAFPTLNDDSIYLSRQTSNSDQYILYVNQSPSVSSPAPKVRTQNLELSNGVAHVVDQFTFFRPAINNADRVDTSKITFESDTLFVTKDAYVNGGSSARKTFNIDYVWIKKNSSPSSTRRGLAQYPVKAPSFSGRIGSAKVGIYVYRIDGDAGLSLYQDEYKDWDEHTLTYNNSPAFGTTPMNSISLPKYAFEGGGINRWYTVDITPYYVSALAGNQLFINIGFDTNFNQLMGFWSKDYMDGQYKSYIVLTSPPQTLLKFSANNPVIVDAETASKIITLNELKLSGTDDKNITYTLKSVPENGYIVLNGSPLSINSSFTQQQIAKGAVKYLYIGSGTTDNFSVEAKDFQGGYYNDILTVNIQIQ